VLPARGYCPREEYYYEQRSFVGPLRRHSIHHSRSQHPAESCLIFSGVWTRKISELFKASCSEHSRSILLPSIAQRTLRVVKELQVSITFQ
jgi:hypothetical protein